MVVRDLAKVGGRVRFPLAAPKKVFQCRGILFLDPEQRPAERAEVEGFSQRQKSIPGIFLNYKYFKTFSVFIINIKGEKVL